MSSNNLPEDLGLAASFVQTGMIITCPTKTLSLQKMKVAEASRQMEIHLINRSPGRPMGMGRLISAFIEICPPGLPGNWCSGAHIFFKQGIWDAELDKP